MKKALYVIGVILLLVVITTAIGIRSFSQKWFKETPNQLTLTSELHPISFQWIEGKHGDYLEPYEVIKIPVFIKGVSSKLYMQFDTGAPSTILYGNALENLKLPTIIANQAYKEKDSYLSDFEFMIGENILNLKEPNVLEAYGEFIDVSDTITEWKIGTIGADFLANKITTIDFKNNQIGLYKERPGWMRNLPKFEKFDFKGRRFMLPAIFNGKKVGVVL